MAVILTSHTLCVNYRLLQSRLIILAFTLSGAGWAYKLWTCISAPWKTSWKWIIVLSLSTVNLLYLFSHKKKKQEHSRQLVALVQFQWHRKWKSQTVCHELLFGRFTSGQAALYWVPLIHRIPFLKLMVWAFWVFLARHNFFPVPSWVA